MTVNEIIVLLLALQFKHLLGDFIFQTKRMIACKGIYGHPAGIAHSAIHAALSFVVLIIYPGITTAIALLIAIGEFIVHYHIDWAKEQVSKRGQWKYEDNAFWFAIGIDQYLHQICYVALIYLLANHF